MGALNAEDGPIRQSEAGSAYARDARGSSAGSDGGDANVRRGVELGEEGRVAKNNVLSLGVHSQRSEPIGETIVRTRHQHQLYRPLWLHW